MQSLLLWFNVCLGYCEWEFENKGMLRRRTVPAFSQPCVQAVIQTLGRNAVRVDEAPAQGTEVGFAISISGIEYKTRDLWLDCPASAFHPKLLWIDLQSGMQEGGLVHVRAACSWRAVWRVLHTMGFSKWPSSKGWGTSTRAHPSHFQN